MLGDEAVLMFHSDVNTLKLIERASLTEKYMGSFKPSVLSHRVHRPLLILYRIESFTKLMLFTKFVSEE